MRGKVAGNPGDSKITGADLEIFVRAPEVVGRGRGSVNRTSPVAAALAAKALSAVDAESDRGIDPVDSADVFAGPDGSAPAIAAARAEPSKFSKIAGANFGGGIAIASVTAGTPMIDVAETHASCPTSARVSGVAANLGGTPADASNLPNDVHAPMGPSIEPGNPNQTLEVSGCGPSARMTTFVDEVSPEAARMDHSEVGVIIGSSTRAGGREVTAGTTGPGDSTSGRTMRVNVAAYANWVPKLQSGPRAGAAPVVLRLAGEDDAVHGVGGESVKSVPL